MAPPVLPAEAQGPGDLHMDGSYRSLLEGSPVSKLLKMSAGTLKLYDNELSQKDFLDERRAIFGNIFPWVLKSACYPYPAVATYEDCTNSGKESKKHCLFCNSSSVSKVQHENGAFLEQCNVVSLQIPSEIYLLTGSSMPRTNIQSLPSTTPPWGEGDGKMSSLQSQFEICKVNKGTEQLTTTIEYHRVPDITTKHFGFFSSLLRSLVLSDTTPIKLRPNHTLQMSVTECHFHREYFSKSGRKSSHSYSNDRDIHQLSTKCTGPVSRNVIDSAKPLNQDISNMAEEALSQYLVNYAIYMVAGYILLRFVLLVFTYILQAMISGGEVTKELLQSTTVVKSYPVNIKSQGLMLKCISNCAIYNTNNSNMNQYMQGQVDIQKVADSVYNSIVQRCETPSAIQAALACQNETILDRIANTIIIEITRHLQPLLSGDTLQCPSGDNVERDVQYPICGPTKSPVYSDVFLEDVISGILSKIVVTANTVNSNHEIMPECKLSDTAVQLVPPLLEEISKYQIRILHVNTDMKVTQPDENDANKVVDFVSQKVADLFGSYQAAEKALICNGKRFVDRIMCVLLSGISGYHMLPLQPRDVCPLEFVSLEAENIIQKIQNNVKKLRQKTRSFSPLTTMLPSKVLDDIVNTLISKIFPSTSISSGSQSSLSDSQFKDMVLKLTQEVMKEISNHEIWYTQDATYIQCAHKPKDVEVSVSKCDTQMQVPDSIPMGDNDSEKRISRLLIREISNPNFMADQPTTSPSSGSASPSCVVEHILCGLDVSWERSPQTDEPGIYCDSFLEDILSGLVSRIFFAISDHIKKEMCKHTSEAGLNKMAESFVKSLVTEVDKTGIKVKKETQARPETGKSVVDLIVNCIFVKLFEDFENKETLFQCLNDGCSLLPAKVACFLVSAISYYQLQVPVSEDCSPFTSIDSNAIVLKIMNNLKDDSYRRSLSGSSAPVVKVPSATSVNAVSVLETVLGDITQPPGTCSTETTLLSSTILEEIIARFLCKLFFNCPNVSPCSKEMSSTALVKSITEKLLNALLFIIPTNNITLSQDSSEPRSVHPKDSQVIEKVVEEVYSNTYYLCGSHMSIYENLARKDDLAPKIAGLVIGEISNYQFQPCYPHGKLSDKYVSTQSGYIVQRVLNRIRGMPHYSQLFESTSQVLYAPFLEEIVSQFLTKMYVSSNFLQLSKTKSNSVEAELSKIASQMINTVLKEMVKSEINVIKPANEQLHLHPEDEDFIAVVVDAVYSNALREAGTPFKLFKAITSGCSVVSERIASLVIKELSKFQLQSFPAPCISCDVYTDIEVAKIVGKVFTEVAAQSALSDNAENIVHSITYKITDPRLDESEPIIVPRIIQDPLKIDPALIIDHLAVFSIKTESVDILEKHSLLQSGKTLAELRRDAVSGMDALQECGIAEPLSSEFQVEDRLLKYALLDKFGRINYKPRRLNGRNSFFSLLKPDITTVQLLEDVTTKQELLVRLLTHNIAHHDDDEDLEEKVLKEYSCLPAPPSKTQVLMAKVSSIVTKKGCCSCCGPSGTKTKDSQKAKPKEQNGSVSHLNKNCSASQTEKIRKSRNSIVDVLHFMNSDRTNDAAQRGWNNNASIATRFAGYQSDFNRHLLALDSSLTRSILGIKSSRPVESSYTSCLKLGRPDILQYNQIPWLFQQIHQPSSMAKEWHLPDSIKDVRYNRVPIKAEPQTEKCKLPHLPVPLFQPFPQCPFVGNQWQLPVNKKVRKRQHKSSKAKPKKESNKVLLPLRISSSGVLTCSSQASSKSSSEVE
ncbi:uncharacterized protein LOC144829088 [Lissotriton helveticus]